MSPASDPTDIVLARYIAGESGAAEARDVEARLAASPSLRQRAAEIRLLLDVQPRHAPPDAGKLWSKIRDRAAAQDLAPAANHPRPLRRLRWQANDARAIGVVAAMLLLAVAGGGLFLLSRRQPATASAVDREPRRYSTARGQNATIRLLDGTRVTLAPQSRLTIPAAFGTDLRELSLDGEAIFDVRHDAAHPFRVRAHGAEVEDIGTRFDLRAYQNEPLVTVAVSEGAVALGQARVDSTGARTSNAEGIVLHRGEVGTLDEHGGVSATRAASVSRYLGWSSGRLAFAGEPLPDVLRTIGRWYDLDVRVPDARLASRLVTAEFSTQSASEMIAALALAVDARVERVGRVVTLKPK